MEQTLKTLAQQYKAASRNEKKRKILENIFVHEKKLSDFLGLLDFAKNNNLDLEFSQKVIDSFFKWQFDGPSLISLYKKVKCKITERYFIGNIYRQNMDQKMLEYLYLKAQDDEKFAKTIVDIMLASTLDINNFLSILCLRGANKETEKQLLVEIKKHDQTTSFWIRALDRSLPDSELEKYAKDIISQKILNRSFESAYDVYLDHPESKATPIILKILANKATTEKQVNQVIYSAAENSEPFQIASAKKEKLSEA